MERPPERPSPQFGRWIPFVHRVGQEGHADPRASCGHGAASLCPAASARYRVRCRPLLRGLEQARRSTLDLHVHRTPPMGPWVLITGNWYYRRGRAGRAPGIRRASGEDGADSPSPAGRGLCRTTRSRVFIGSSATTRGTGSRATRTWRPGCSAAPLAPTTPTCNARSRRFSDHEAQRSHLPRHGRLVGHR